jgi:hypothetical protein
MAAATVRRCGVGCGRRALQAGFVWSRNGEPVTGSVVSKRSGVLSPVSAGSTVAVVPPRRKTPHWKSLAACMRQYPMAAPVTEESEQRGIVGQHHAAAVAAHRIRRVAARRQGNDIGAGGERLVGDE